MSILNPAAVGQQTVAQAREAFQNARPYKHIVIDDFLSADVAESLYANFPKMTQLRKHYKGLNENKSEGSSFGDYHTDFVRVLEAIKGEAFIKTWLEPVTGIADLVLPDDHRGAGVHQGRNGSFLDIHVDFSVHPILNLHRRLNLLIYLNKDWEEAYGGHLELWNEDVSVLEKKVLVGFNRAVIFETTDTSYHGYDVINIPEDQSRKSIYSYYYSPLAEGVKYHDTIFKPRPTDSRSKRVKTNAKESLKNTVKGVFQKLGMKSVFEKFE
ncbi:2OG-Fe(II) oxygenase [Phaeodactylibacter luteus]|uniref:2OG-Fe(II) oxygenase n=1 Tax=Phaeodactylibacter luteus TaxID=1564516 RepID=A0A5C6RI55_9BACT|nr:2OG-Fe(II) oxygenase [Phaeodactylibacter luteus]TXB61340.1 2OG-Fe(II) oxygenase [Phaeodactylibacter luteus]